MTSLSSKRLEVLLEKLKQHADKNRINAMQAYLKTQQPMFGVMAPARKTALKETLCDHPISDQIDYLQFVNAQWSHSHREVQYCAIDTAAKHKRYHTADAVSLFEKMAWQAKWWDLTDNIACNLIGSLLLIDRSYQTTLDVWAQHSDLWIRRTSLLAHLKHKHEMDIEAVSNTILTLTTDKQFFIQKAIGWILREYSKTDSVWVREFIDLHHLELSRLAIKEGSRRL
jgi:3-methyladenine DNA glycosylase AlkD